MRTHVTSLEDGGLTKAYQIAHDARGHGTGAFAG